MIFIEWMAASNVLVLVDRQLLLLESFLPLLPSAQLRLYLVSLYAVSDSYEPRGYDVPVVTHLIGGNISFCRLAGLRPIKKC